MGTDIHAFVEAKQLDGTWQIVNPPEFPETPDQQDWSWKACQIRENLWAARAGREPEWFVDRNYRLFGALAGVRFEGPEPKGLPPGLSPEVSEANEWRLGDVHNHSFWTLEELRDLLDLPENSDLVQEVLPRLEELGLPPDHVRLVFWFDN